VPFIKRRIVTLLAEDRYGASFSTPYVDPWTNISNPYYR
jgi:hypothetical protein